MLNIYKLSLKEIYSDVYIVNALPSFRGVVSLADMSISSLFLSFISVKILLIFCNSQHKSRWLSCAGDFTLVVQGFESTNIKLIEDFEYGNLEIKLLFSVLHQPHMLHKLLFYMQMNIRINFVDKVKVVVLS